MVLVGLIVLGLFFVERTIRLRRHRAAMIELDKQIQERLAAGGRIQPRAVLDDARNYVKGVDATGGRRT